jgi:hypothetical protein
MKKEIQLMPELPTNDENKNPDINLNGKKNGYQHKMEKGKYSEYMHGDRSMGKRALERQSHVGQQRHKQKRNCAG